MVLSASSALGDFHTVGGLVEIAALREEFPEDGEAWGLWTKDKSGATDGRRDQISGGEVQRLGNGELWDENK